MKTISIDFDLYQTELSQAQCRGYNNAKNDFLNALRTLYVKCDKKEAWIQLFDIFENDTKIVSSYFGLEKKE